MKALIPVSILAVVAAVALLVIRSQPAAVQEAVSSPDERRPMSELAMPDLGGNIWQLSDHRGKVVLVNFWATWCPPCRAETPALVDLANHYADKGVQVVGISLDQGGADPVRKFAADYRIPYPILMPPADSRWPSAISAIPTTFLVDRHGRTARKYVGAVSEQTFRQDIDRLLVEAD